MSTKSVVQTKLLLRIVSFSHFQYIRQNTTRLRLWKHWGSTPPERIGMSSKNTNLRVHVGDDRRHPFSLMLAIVDGAG